MEVQVSSLRTRDDVFKLKRHDIVVCNGLLVLVREIVVAMGGDVCVSGFSVSWSHQHSYNVYMGNPVFWGPKGMTNNLTDYLNNRFLGRRDP